MEVAYMEHLTQNQINKLTYYYLNRKILSNELVNAKKHMAQCQSCYEKLCISIVAAHELGEKKLIDISMLADGNESQNIFVRINSVAGKLQVSVNEALEKTMAKLWNFMPESQIAVARGEDNKNNQTFVNQQSEYSSITLQDNHLVIRLDDEYFSNARYEAVYTENGEEIIIPFSYNEMEECLEVTVEIKSSDYELIIRESNKE